MEDHLPPGRLNRDGIRIHEPAEFDGMRAAGRVVGDILDRIDDDRERDRVIARRWAK